MTSFSTDHLPHLTELASGIDALYLSGWGDVTPGFLADLEAAKQLARASKEPVTIDLGPITARVAPTGLNSYPYCLVLPEGRIAVTGSEKLPPIHVQPTAEFLHAVGPTGALDHFSGIVASFVGNLRWSAHRLDLFSDWQGWMPEAEDRTRFVGRAVDVVTHELSGELTGFEIGRRKTKTITARLYDKSRDVQVKGSDWWPDVWGDRYNRSERVLRVEFEFGRRGLKQYGIDSAAEAIVAAPRLWHSATEDWLSLRTRTDDATRSRWPVAPEWLAIQSPSFAEGAIGLDRVKAGRTSGSLRRVIPPLNGYLASAAAHLGVNSIDAALEAVRPYLHDYELVGHRTFLDRVLTKCRELGLA